MRASVHLLRNDALGMRIPSVLGYALFSLSLYRFVGRRTTPLYGLVAMLFPEVTTCWYYATEGRPYALMLACSGIASVCWQSIVFQERRALMLAGLGLSLWCAVNLHYYSVLLFVPFWIAESVRTYIRRRVDVAVWLATTVPLLGLLIYIPVIRASKANSGIPYAFFAESALSKAFWKFAGFFFEPALVALICIGVVYFCAQFFDASSAHRAARETIANRREILPEVSLILGFTLVPVFAILVSRFGTHVFFPRYGIAGVFGIAALIGFSAWRAFSERRGPALMLVCVLGVLICRDRLRDDLPAIRAERATPARLATLGRIPKVALKDDLPIVPTNLDDFMQFFYYGDKRFRNRLFYVSSEPLAQHYLGFTFHERMMLGSAPFFGTQVVEYAKFLREHRSFYVFGSLDFSEWVVPKLMADGVELRLIQGGPKNIFGGFADVCFRADVPTHGPRASGQALRGEP